MNVVPFETFFEQLTFSYVKTYVHILKIQSMSQAEKVNMAPKMTMINVFWTAYPVRMTLIQGCLKRWLSIRPSCSGEYGKDFPNLYCFRLFEACCLTLVSTAIVFCSTGVNSMAERSVRLSARTITFERFRSFWSGFH